MKRFLTQYIFYFFLFFVLLAGVNLLLNKQVSRSGQYQLPDVVHTILLGNSHAECAYNDSLMNGVMNFAQSGESYFYSYVKVKALLKFNPQIKRVAIEVTNNMFEKSIDGWVAEHKYIAYRYPKYSHFFEADQRFLLLGKNPYSVMEVQNTTFKTKLDYLRNRQQCAYRFFDWGKYRPFSASKIDSLRPILEKELRKLKAEKNKPQPTSELSIVNLAYLNKIVRFCQSNKIRVVFVRAPQHHLYSIPLPDNLFRSSVQSMYPEISFLDMNKLELTDEEFLDFEHVNNKGAQKVSLHLDSLLRIL